MSQLVLDLKVGSQTEMDKNKCPLRSPRMDLYRFRVFLNSEKRFYNTVTIRCFLALRKYALNCEERTQRLTEIENHFLNIYKALSYLADKYADTNRNMERTKIDDKKQISRLAN